MTDMTREDPDNSAEMQDVQNLLSLCSLAAGERIFGIDTGTIREVLGQCRPNRVPLAHAFIAGVIAYRGEVVTAVSLRALLGMPPGEGMGCVLVLDGDATEERFGLLVDSVGGVVMVDPNSISSNPSTLDEASRLLFSGAFRTEHGLLVQLAPDQLRPSALALSGLFGHGAGPIGTRLGMATGGNSCTL